MEDGDDRVVKGVIRGLSLKQTRLPSRNGHSDYATFTVNNDYDQVEVVVWPEDWHRLWRNIMDAYMEKRHVVIGGKHVVNTECKMESIRERTSEEADSDAKFNELANHDI